MADDARIAAEILRLAGERGPARSLCPSEAARALDPEGWRSLLGPVRRVAVHLAQEGRIEILRKGRPMALPLAPEAVRGVIRLRLAGGGGA